MNLSHDRSPYRARTTPEVRISPLQFASAYERFQGAVEAYSGEPFVDFRTGLPERWERYKIWLYHEARRLLAFDRWTPRQIGSGTILRHTIDAIEIKRDNEHRNNIVEWETKGRGKVVVSHYLMLDARASKPSRKAAEDSLYRMYVELLDPAQCFAELAELFGARYDLISYLFFLRDVKRFVPLRPTIFPQAFELLGVPHAMRGRCNWENYQGFLARLREVQRHLDGYIQDEVRLIDAHSFCWMLVKLPPAEKRKRSLATVERIVPIAGSSPSDGGTGGSRFTNDELQKQKALQKRIGDIAQRVVLTVEQNRLRKLGLRDLANRVEDVSDDLSLAYDIASRNTDGTLKPIEVKAAARRGDDLRFFLSANEKAASSRLPGYTFALVFGVESPSPKILEFPGTELPSGALHACQYEVRLRDPGQ